MKEAENIYKVLTNKKFRAGPLPLEETKGLIINKIKSSIKNNQPIQLLQFWGGCKNTNLGVINAELSEEATLNHLKKLNDEIEKIYIPGLKIVILPGDARVERINYISNSMTSEYVSTLECMINDKQLKGLFTVVPVSKLYAKYSLDFERKLIDVRGRISDEIEKHQGFERLMLNSRKNVCKDGCQSDEELVARSIKAAKEYVIHRVAEEEALIFRDFECCIRSFFIKYIPFYKEFISDVFQTKPSLDCSLIFYTGGKGNITQPWQSVGVERDDKVIFLSQERLKMEALTI